MAWTVTAVPSKSSKPVETPVFARFRAFPGAIDGSNRSLQLPHGISGNSRAQAVFGKAEKLRCQAFKSLRIEFRLVRHLFGNEKAFSKSSKGCASNPLTTSA